MKTTKRELQTFGFGLALIIAFLMSWHVLALPRAGWMLIGGFLAVLGVISQFPDRKFLCGGVILTMYGLLFFHLTGGPFNAERLILAVLSVLLYIAASFEPEALTAVYRVWMKAAHFIGSVVTGIIFTVVYFVLFTPVSLLLKVLQKDMLKSNIDKKLESYWQEKVPREETEERYFKQY